MSNWLARSGWTVAGWWLIGLLVALAPMLRALADPPAPAAEQTDKRLPPAEQLAADQERVAERFRALKEKLAHLAEIMAATHPRQAALLRQAVAKSDELDVEDQFAKLVELLKKDQLSLGLRGENQLGDSLNEILELLVSEGRAKQIESERARIKEYLKQINLLAKEQKALEASATPESAPTQGKLADRAEDLAKKIEKNEGRKQLPNGEKKETGKKDTDKKDTDKKNPDKKDSDPKDGDQQDGGKDKPSPDREEKGSQPEGKPEDKPKEDSPSDQSDESSGSSSEQDSDDGQPATQKHVERAHRRMREAEENLKKANQSKAREKQREALRELADAKAALEAILRQLREEEQGQRLKMLEARFAAMLKMQNEVHEGTRRADRVPEADRDHDHEVECGRLGRKESEIVAECDRALVMLLEDRSTVAFPEAITDIRDQMKQVATRLSQAKTGELTQSIEQEISQSLEEMIAAFKKAQKKLENQKQRGGQGGGGGGGLDDGPPLVDNLAEIKMIRALQVRVNQRTERFAKMLQSEQADKPDLIEALKELARREERIHRVTRDIVTKKNQ